MRFIFLQLVHQHDRACKSDVLLTFQLEVNREILRAFLLVAVLDFISSDQDFFVQDLIEPKLLSSNVSSSAKSPNRSGIGEPQRLLEVEAIRPHEPALG